MTVVWSGQIVLKNKTVAELVTQRGSVVQMQLAVQIALRVLGFAG